MSFNSQGDEDPVKQAELPIGLSSLLTEVSSYDLETGGTIRLIPTEGLMSPLQKAMFSSVQYERYLHAPLENIDKAIRYPDIRRLQNIYQVCKSSIGNLLEAKFVNPDLLSGLQAMQVVLLATSMPGDLVLTLSPDHGGHEVTIEMLHRFGRRHKYLPFNEKEHTVCVESLDSALDPAVVYIDQSNILFPHDLRAIKKAYPNAILIFDVAQVLGIIAGGNFPNPLNDGADVIVGSCHKSMNGPQKGIIATNSPQIADRVEVESKVFVSNNHPASTAALAVCFLEASVYGRAYAKQIVSNANELGATLEGLGVPVYRCRKDGSYTQSQHIWVDSAKLDWCVEEAVQSLYKQNIVTNTCFLVRGGKHDNGARGLRLGTTEVTRLGMKEEEMRLIASGIATVLKGESRDVGMEMAHLRGKFNRVKYCFDSSNWNIPDAGILTDSLSYKDA